MRKGMENQVDQLNQQVAQLYQKGRYEQAIGIAKRVCDLTRQLLGDKHPDFAASLSNLALLYKSMGDYADAESLLRQAMEITRKAFGEGHLCFAKILNNLAELYYSMGNYADAEPLYCQAMEIQRKCLGEEHPDFAKILSNLGDFYRLVGNYADAESLLRQAMEIQRKCPGEDHPDFATSLNNLALLYKSIGNYADAEPLYRQAMKIRCKVLGKEHPDFAQSLNNLAFLYHSMGKYADAEPLYRQAMEIRCKTLGKDHPDFAGSLNNLALLYKSMGNYADAEPLLRQAMGILRKVLGDEYPYFATSLNNLAALCIATGREEEAMQMMKQATAIYDGLIGQVFSIGSEKDRMAYIKNIQGHFDFFISLVYQYFPQVPSAVCTCLDLVLRRKAIGAEASAVQRDAVLSGRYPELEPKLRELNMLRMQIARKSLAGPGPEGLETHRQLLAEWGKRKERLESDLAHQIPEMNMEQRLRDADRGAVASALPEGVVLIEFVRFNLFNFHAVPARGESQWKPACYLAFVLPADEADNVQMIDLGESERIDMMIAQFRASITGEVVHCDIRDAIRESKYIQVAGDDEGCELYAALFKPLSAAIGDRRRLFLAPDGDLTRLPFEALPVSDGRRLIDDYHVSYLSTGRDALRFGIKAVGHPTDSLVIADPDFNLKAETVVETQPANVPLEASKPIESFVPLGRRSRDIKSRHFNPLPGTRIEGEKISEMLSIKPWLRETALEARLRTLRSPCILHMATHGFFLENQKHDLNADDMDRLSGPGLENPMLRSGIVLAGVNTWLQGGNPPAQAEDGILTAEDVSGLDLLDTELVVLSACETGLGEVLIGEGVFGLRRSFVLAGARTLIMSLWKVPDKQTQELMQDFYSRILKGQPRSDALRDAQLAMKARYSEPCYWGAFICQGDPSPI